MQQETYDGYLITQGCYQCTHSSDSCSTCRHCCVLLRVVLKNEGGAIVGGCNLDVVRAWIPWAAMPLADTMQVSTATALTGRSTVSRQLESPHCSSQPALALEGTYVADTQVYCVAMHSERFRPVPCRIRLRQNSADRCINGCIAIVVTWL
jgi:hypothetical protein